VHATDDAAEDHVIHHLLEAVEAALPALGIAHHERRGERLGAKELRVRVRHGARLLRVPGRVLLIQLRLTLGVTRTRMEWAAAIAAASGEASAEAGPHRRALRTR